MILNRILPVALLATASAWAQLPPSSLTPTRPAPPARPVPPSRPVNPLQPLRPQAPPAAETPATPPVIDLSNGIPNTLTSEEQAQGWKLLFDGTRLVGLRGVQRTDPLGAGWKIENGELNLPKEIRDTDRMTGGDLVTAETFWDFEFRFEWKASVSANGGVRYMLSQTMGQTPIGLEYQIIDDVHNSVGLKGGALRRTGALDNILPVGPNAKLRTADPLARKGDPWNEGRIVVQGNRVQHWLNGEKVLEFELGPQLRTLAEKNAEPGSRPLGPYFGSKIKTAICILDEGTEIAYRNLKVRSLVPQAVVAPPNGRPATPGTTSNVPDPFLIRPRR
jgi:hypothetical protein